MQGTLIKYGPAPSHLAFISAAQQGEDNSVSGKHLVLVGGLTEGFMYAEYVPPLTQALTAAGWHVVQAQLSSSYQGWGCSSLDRDADELLLLCHWLVEHRSATALVILGHSTGCNDIVRLMQKVAVKDLLLAPGGTADPAASKGKLPIVGTILQAPASDNELLSTFPGLDVAASKAREMVSLGKGEQLVMRMPHNEFTYGAPMTARRLISLYYPEGDDDMFSTALTDEQLKTILSHVGSCPCLAIASGSDECVPPPYNTNISIQVERIARAISEGGCKAQSVVVDGAGHWLKGYEGVMVEKVAAFMQSLSI